MLRKAQACNEQEHSTPARFSPTPGTKVDTHGCAITTHCNKTAPAHELVGQNQESGPQHVHMDGEHGMPGRGGVSTPSPKPHQAQHLNPPVCCGHGLRHLGLVCRQVIQAHHSTTLLQCRDNGLSNGASVEACTQAVQALYGTPADRPLLQEYKSSCTIAECEWSKVQLHAVTTINTL